MRRVTVLVGLLSTVALSACAVAPPQGPDVVAMPGQGKDFTVFQQDDMACRQYASAQTGGVSAAQAGTNSAVGSAVLGTALGAAAGAALGSVGGAVGAGAAIGGATGLLAGSAIGAGNAQASEAGMQQRYDVSYAQCMTAHGNSVQAPPPSYAASYPYPYAYPPPPPYYGYGPAWYGPSIGIGIGGGWGRDHDHWRR
jgi:hypothetical protein